MTEGAGAAPLRVALVVAQLRRGGTERQVELLATGMHERGHRVLVLTLFEGGAHADALRARGVDVRGPMTTSRPLAPLRALIALIRVLRDERPQVVHAFLLGACAVAGPAAVLARVPVRLAGRRSLGDWKRGKPAAVAVERATNVCFTAFVANADAVAVDARRREHLPEARVHVIRNALPAEAFLPSRPPVDDPAFGLPRPLLLCVANLINYKGHRYLLEAQRLLREDGITCGLMVAGGGEERAALTGMITRYALPATLLGSRSDVGALLDLCDLVVLPSLHEGMSNALMEAMARGRAVVATDVGGNREVLGDAGVLCGARDPRALADAMAGLATDPERRAELGARARRRATELFGLSRLVDEHVALYRKLLSSRAQVTGASGAHVR